MSNSLWSIVYRQQAIAGGCEESQRGKEERAGAKGGSPERSASRRTEQHEGGFGVFSVRGLHLKWVVTKRTFHPHRDGVHSTSGGLARGMCAVLATLKAQSAALKETLPARLAANETVDARVALPIRRTYPAIGTPADFSKNTVHVSLLLPQVFQEEFVAAEREHNVGRTESTDEMFQRVGLCPELGG